MNLRQDLSRINNQALFLYLVMTNQNNMYNLNNIISVLSSKYYSNTDNSNTDYTNDINSLLDAKKKAIIDINNAANIAISQTKQVAEEAKQVAEEAKQIATEAKQISTEAKQISIEAKQIATEAKQIVEEAKQLADIIISSNQYSILLEKINQVYEIATEAKQIATEAKVTSTDVKQIVNELSINQNNIYTDLLSRIDYLFNSFYRATSTDIFQKYGNIP